MNALAVLGMHAGVCQTGGGNPVFEVASVRPVGRAGAAPAAAPGVKIGPGRVEMASLSLAEVIGVAYGMKLYQISGPGWMYTDRFNIVAKIPSGVPAGQVPGMLQALLTERFKVSLHREVRMLASYALVAGRDGPKLEAMSSDEAAAPGSRNSARMSPGSDGRMRVSIPDATLEGLAAFLTRFLDRPVIDMTGLKGRYAISLDIAAEDLWSAARSASARIVPGPGREPDQPTAAMTADRPGLSIMDAVQKLGLKLAAQKAPATFLIIDHLDRALIEN